MTSLLDSPPNDELVLLRAVADGYASAGRWPVWQYVLLTLNRAGYDADDVVRHLRTWAYNYRAAWWRSGGPMSAPAPGEAIALTVYGMIHSGHPAMLQLASAHVAAVRAAAARYVAFEPSPTDVVPLVLDGDDLTRAVNAATGAPVAAAELREILSREPATWSGLGDRGDSFVWDLANSQVHRFNDAADVEQYLVVLSDYLGTALASAPASSLHASALPDALDRLDLVWQVVMGGHLVRIPRAAVPIELTVPVADREDFSSRVSALAEMLGTVAAPKGRKGRDGSLAGMLGPIKEKLPGDDVAVDAVHTLEQVRGVRHSLQHQAGRAQYRADWQALGLAGYGDDWSGCWESVRHQTVRALNALGNRLLAQHDLDNGAEVRPPA